MSDYDDIILQDYPSVYALRYGRHSRANAPRPQFRGWRVKMTVVPGAHRACDCANREEHRGRGMAGLGCSYPLATAKANERDYV